MQTPLLTELEAATRLGITPAQLAAVRKEHLFAESHWVKKGHQIKYTPAALLTVATILGEQKAPLPTAEPNSEVVAQTPEETAPLPPLEGAEAAWGAWVPDPAAGPIIATLVVLKSGLHGIKNRRILEAYRLGDDPRRGDPILRVEVVDNSNFIAGMHLQCRFVSQDLWTHWDVTHDCAARSPRVKGRW